jgi:hypothetical protein
MAAGDLASLVIVLLVIARSESDDAIQPFSRKAYARKN